MVTKRIIAVQHANGKVEIECANCGNPMTVEQFDPEMEPLYYCQKCGEFTNEDPMEIDDPTKCPECGQHRRCEIDVEDYGTSLGYVYSCGECGNVWTIRECTEER